jgi:hypothetical protein
MHTPSNHAWSGIRTHDHSVRAIEDSSCLRLSCYRDRLSFLLILNYLIVVVIVFIVRSVLYCLCSFVSCVLFQCGVLRCVMCVICVLCLIVVPLPPGKNPLAADCVSSWQSHPCQIRQRVGSRRSVAPGSPGWVLGVELTTRPRKNLLLWDLWRMPRPSRVVAPVKNNNNNNNNNNNKEKLSSKYLFLCVTRTFVS